MESGAIVEYIDRQKIMGAVVLTVKDQRLHVLTENNREMNLSAKRLAHSSPRALDPSLSRDQMLAALKQIVNERKSLIDQINIKDLWDVLKTEQEWIDLTTMTAFCFPEDPSPDHESAVVRAFFNNRLYFKFNPDRFYPNSEQQVERLLEQQRQAAYRERVVARGSRWLRALLNGDAPRDDGQGRDYGQILKSLYLHEKNSASYALGQEMLKRAGLDGSESIFKILVKAGIFQENENIELHRLQIPLDFGQDARAESAALRSSPPAVDEGLQRRDLTALPLMTIDGQATLDFDDALSLEPVEGHYRLGVHIADVAHYVRRGGPLDREAMARGSSIYMPDRKISMLPTDLAEDLCSLKAGEIRPAITTLVDLTPEAEVLRFEIFPSLVRVQEQLSYFDANLLADAHPKISVLRKIAESFRRKRLAEGAIHITLPEIHVWVGGSEEININRLNRESPGRMLVAELMIMANWLMGRFLAEHRRPAVFRSQPPPRERLFKDTDATLFQNWMQRRLLSRFVLTPEPDPHAGLGLDIYTTATSPIRKYLDLATQRQLRSVFGLETGYVREEVEEIITRLQEPLSNVGRLQHSRQRYWILKFLEGQVGRKEEAIVLKKRRRTYQILIPAYMLECELPLTSGIDLKPEDLIQITIQHVDARRDILSVFMG